VNDQPSVNRIIPHNLTAQAAFDVVGNPPSSRPESGVANCYPGLEYDHRNLDRRFFPGLVVEFLSQEDATAPKARRQGAQVMSTNTSDVGLRQLGADDGDRLAALRSGLNLLQASIDTGTAWFVESIDQGGGTLLLSDSDGVPLDGLVVWRLVRSLRPGPVTLVVAARDTASEGKPLPDPVMLAGWRRRYTDAETGVIDLTYQPGELTQSLCSPWTHDFRDCSCTYWASNHPDLVTPPEPEEDRLAPSGGPADTEPVTARVNWLRDPEVAQLLASALPSQAANRPYEISYFQINQQWQDLAVVVEGREIDGLYVPRSQASDFAVPFASDEELVQALTRLASLEHVVALLYLYALFTVRDTSDVPEGASWPTLRDDVIFTRSVVLDVAVQEMQHFRWANQLLAGVSEATGRPYSPAVAPPALTLPDSAGQWTVPVTLQPLTLETLESFIQIERSSAFIDGQYARVAATLQDVRFPDHLYQLASNIAEEGEEHFIAFRDVQRILTPYGATDPVYLRHVVEGDPASPDVAAVLDTYKRILQLVATGYQFASRQNQEALGEARTLMFRLQEGAEALARQGAGIPFLSPWR
jgi:Ferritin-like